MFTFHTDPGHGWLEVSAANLTALNLNPRSFSQYSYRKGADRFFLEEDCDATIFVEAYEAKHGHAPKFTDKYSGRSFVRNLPAIHQG